jgi:predicted Zn finger-like uncharacterized protein
LITVADYTFTRCPGCGTIFRVTAEQLALREGQVRCGHCRAVFDANDHVIALDARRSDDVGVPDELAAGRPTITLRSAAALEPVDERPAQPEASPVGERPAQPEASPIDERPAQPEASPVDERSAEPEPSPVDERGAEPEPSPVDEVGAEPEPSAVDERGAELEPSPTVPIADDALSETSIGDAQHEADAPIDVRALDRAGRFEWKPRKPLRERPRTLYGAAIVSLLIAFAAQGLFEYRDALAAHAPVTRAFLRGACHLLGCAIEPVRDPAALSIEASDLQADPGHRGLLVLSATIRNRAPYTIALPYLELTLTDASDQVVVRRAFAPADYVGRASDPAAGIPGNGENVVKLFLDASATAQAGYRLYLFYP